MGAVKFTFGLPALSSGRRLLEEGVFRIGMRYSVNFVWATFRHRPFTDEWIDIIRVLVAWAETPIGANLAEETAAHPIVSWPGFGPHSYQDKGLTEQRLPCHRHGRACPGHDGDFTGGG